MRISLAFGPTASLGRAASVSVPSARRARHPHAGVRRPLGGVPEDVGLEALGQVLAEPRRFAGFSDADGANDASRGISPGADARARAGLPAIRDRARLPATTTIAGSFEAAVAIALLAGGSVFAGYPIVHALADSAPVHAMAPPTNVHVTETILPGGARATVETTIRRVEPVPRS